ncbi:XRE family transcriptional regulator [Lactiplantibacillus plantarum]|uniref:helix-turn-helix domain-containing protein n=2 Tax=Lactobacillaceae TaxID=33958 RepID=UPI002F261AA8
MNVGDRMKSIRKQQGISADQLAESIGVSRSTIFRYEKGDIEKMPIEVVANVASSLHVSLIDLMGISNDSISEKITEIVSKLNHDRQQNVYNYADNQLKEQNNAIVRMPRTQIKLLGAVSAGTGEELQDDTTEVDYTGTVPEYDYALQVNGDSMEPLFTDQQIIFVKYSEEAFNGQIVIAYVDGKAYVKKYHCNGAKCELVSLNSKYDPIDVSGNENFKIKGVVVL